MRGTAANLPRQEARAREGRMTCTDTHHVFSSAEVGTVCHCGAFVTTCERGMRRRK